MYPQKTKINFLYMPKNDIFIFKFPEKKIKIEYLAIKFVFARVCVHIEGKYIKFFSKFCIYGYVCYLATRKY